MSGILAIWNDCAEDGLAHYERWYIREHLPERVGIPGFRSGRRYEAVEAGHRYFTFYEVAHPGVLASQPYLDRLEAPTEGTRRAMASFRHMARTVCEVAHGAGRMRGALTVTARLSAAPPPALAHDFVEELLDLDGVVRAELWIQAAAQTPIGTTEMASRGTPDALVPAAIVSECLRPADAEGLATRIATAAPLLGAAVDIGIYRFLCALESPAP